MSLERISKTERNQPDQKELIRKAIGKIALGKDRLMEKHPFHAAIVNQMPVIAREGIGTMAVGFGPDCIVLLYEPKFVAEVPLKLLPGILKHEVHHIIFNHLLLSRKDYPNRKALIIAEEVTVNEFVKEPLPEWVITLDKYPDLPPMESTLERYKRLDQMFPITTLKLKLPAGDGKSGQSDIHDAQDPKPGGGGGSGPSEQAGKADKEDLPQTLDNHDIWEVEITLPTDQANALDEKAKSEGRTKEEMIEELLQDAMANVKPEQIPPSLQEMCQQHGIDPGGMVEQITRGSKPDPWTLLHKYIGQETGIRPIFTRPPRRYPELVGIFPAYARQNNKPRIMAVLDTSGSISSHMLSQMDANLRKIAKDYEVEIVECDTMIYRTYQFRSRLKEVYGRGGTDFRPPLEEKFLKLHKPDLVLFFTDGYGPAPEKAPKIPVIWAILPYGYKPAEWGKAVFLKN